MTYLENWISARWNTIVRAVLCLSQLHEVSSLRVSTKWCLCATLLMCVYLSATQNIAQFYQESGLRGRAWIHVSQFWRLRMPRSIAYTAYRMRMHFLVIDRQYVHALCSYVWSRNKIPILFCNGISAIYEVTSLKLLYLPQPHHLITKNSAYD